MDFITIHKNALKPAKDIYQSIFLNRIYSNLINITDFKTNDNKKLIINKFNEVFDILDNTNELILECFNYEFYLGIKHESLWIINNFLNFLCKYIAEDDRSKYINRPIPNLFITEQNLDCNNYYAIPYLLDKPIYNKNTLEILTLLIDPIYNIDINAPKILKDNTKKNGLDILNEKLINETDNEQRILINEMQKLLNSKDEEQKTKEEFDFFKRNNISKKPIKVTTRKIKPPITTTESVKSFDSDGIGNVIDYYYELKGGNIIPNNYNLHKTQKTKRLRYKKLSCSRRHRHTPSCKVTTSSRRLRRLRAQSRK